MTIIAIPPAVRTALALTLAAPLWLVACRQAPEPQNDATPANVTANRAANLAEVTDALPQIPANRTITPTDTPAARPVELTPEAAKGEKGARAVLLDWARALERGDWAKAQTLWGDSGRTPENFARDWQKYQHLEVSIGDGDVEGGAGSLYYEVPVTILATLRDGRVDRLAGSVTLRRVNDVDGASVEQLAWHISQGDLQPRP